MSDSDNLVVHENGEVLNTARWTTGAEGIVQHGRMGRVVNHLTPEEIADNEAHDKALASARATEVDDDPVE